MKSSTALVLLLLAISAIGLSIVDDYGVSYDEKTEISIVAHNHALITSGEPIPKDQVSYGLAFNVGAELVYQAEQFLRRGSRYRPLADRDLTDLREKERVVLDRIRLKHKLTFLVSLLAYASVAALVGVLAGRQWAWLGVPMLALFPRFWGHSFFNPKDIPFAAMFTLATAGAVLLFARLEAGGQGSTRRAIHQSLLYGALIGFAGGTRIGAFVLLLLVPIAAVAASPERLRSRTLRFWPLVCTSWAVTTIVIYPASWSDPVGWFTETVRYLSAHGWDRTSLFEGESHRDVPWYYIPKWLSITTPVFLQAAAALGIGFGLSKLRRFTPVQRVAFLLVLQQALFLPAVALLRNSTVYDGMRQFLFVLPALAVTASVGLVWFGRRLPATRVRPAFAITVAALAIPTLADMVRLHPYEHVYFQRLFGGLPAAQDRYETDYWGLSMRECMEWINESSVGPTEVVIGDGIFTGRVFADPHVRVVDLDDYLARNAAAGREARTFYMAMPRFGAHARFPDWEVVHRAARDGVPLAIVKAPREDDRPRPQYCSRGQLSR